MSDEQSSGAEATSAPPIVVEDTSGIPATGPVQVHEGELLSAAESEAITALDRAPRASVPEKIPPSGAIAPTQAPGPEWPSGGPWQGPQAQPGQPNPWSMGLQPGQWPGPPQGQGMQGQGMQGQGMQGQGMQGQPHQSQALQAQHMPPQGYPPQGWPGQPPPWPYAPNGMPYGSAVQGQPGATQPQTTPQMNPGMQSPVPGPQSNPYGGWPMQQGQPGHPPPGYPTQMPYGGQPGWPAGHPGAYPMQPGQPGHGNQPYPAYPPYGQPGQYPPGVPQGQSAPGHAPYGYAMQPINVVVQNTSTTNQVSQHPMNHVQAGNSQADSTRQAPAPQGEWVASRPHWPAQYVQDSGQDVLVRTHERSRMVAVLMSFLLGWVGGQRFYLGQTWWGLISLLFFWTSIPTILGVIQGLRLLFMSRDEFDRLYNYQRTALNGAVVAPAQLPSGHNIV